MKKPSLLFLLCHLFFSQISAQNITIAPYLQDVEPNSLYILWETDMLEESIVEWGLSEALGNVTLGTASTSEGTAQIHEVFINGLERFTKYYYRVKTGSTVSEIYSFKTPPFAEDEESFRLVVMSDMQRDGNFPNKFREMVEDGVIKYLETQFGENLIDHLALIKIPGDLVTNGHNFPEWQNTFFNPAEKLFPLVPVYPVLGNHENNSTYYFKYFKLPDNGTEGYEEHWWYKDYGNTRIIGLNSNEPFSNEDQLNWLEDLLSETCGADSIDFLFAQLHHPHKSELWTPGESAFTGEVIKLLEAFSSGCQKPSIHFFGHTHGYSRGQSRDHKHLWINVATAGGAIDNWGEFPNFDYDEFSVSQDEYGFVMVEVNPGPEASFVVKRVSRGDQDGNLDNIITDSLTIRKENSILNTPQSLSPNNEEIAPECVTLVGSPFSAPNIAAEHGQSHWQVTTLDLGFDNPVAEQWKNFENWYYDIDTQTEDDLTDESITGLEAFTDYIWRVRYRDKEMNWSDWSNPVPFSTSASLSPPNKVLNFGAENELENWTILEGVVESLESKDCNGIPAYGGNKYFAVGGLCEHSPVGRAAQIISVVEYADSIDTGNFLVSFGGYLSNYAGTDLPEMKLIFLDENDFPIGESNTLGTLSDSWTLLGEQLFIPTQTRSIQMELKGTRNGGTDNDSYFDDLFLKLGPNTFSCDETSSTQNPSTFRNIDLKISPNPSTTETKITVPNSISSEYIIGVTDMMGNKVFPSYSKNGNSILVNTESLTSGTYILWLRNQKGILARGRFIISRE